MSLVVVTESLEGSSLADAALAGRVPAAWYVTRPTTPAAWDERVTTLRTQFAARDWFTPLRPAFASGADDGTARLARVAAAGGVVVTTGQQPGLFGGPIYTWTKALSALALADALEESMGVPVAPVFWAATDDADFDEASWTMVPVVGGVRTLRLSRPTSVGAALSDVPLPDCSALLAELALGAGSAPHAAVLDIARRSYAQGMTVGGAYVALLRALLEPLGVAVLDASHPAVRAAAFPTLHEALLHAADIERALAARDGAITDAGFAPQVGAVEGRALVFARDSARSGAKERVPVSAASNVARLATPDSLSPNVLLRPVVERAVLPTVGYLGGPGEVAYFSQVTAVAETLKHDAPLVLPRWSGTIIEAHVQQLLDRYELVPGDLRDPHATERAMAAAALPAAVRGRLIELRAVIDREATSARSASDNLLPGPVLDGFRNAVHHRIDRLERRYLAAVKRRDADTMRDVATLRGALFPGGKRQERSANFLPMLARHGPALWAQLLEAVREHARLLVHGEQRDRTDAARAAVSHRA